MGRVETGRRGASPFMPPACVSVLFLVYCALFPVVAGCASVWSFFHPGPSLSLSLSLSLSSPSPLSPSFSAPLACLKLAAHLNRSLLDMTSSGVTCPPTHTHTHAHSHSLTHTTHTAHTTHTTITHTHTHIHTFTLTYSHSHSHTHTPTHLPSLSQSLLNIAWAFMTVLGSMFSQYESVVLALKFIRLVAICRWVGGRMCVSVRVRARVCVCVYVDACVRECTCG